MCKLLLTRKRHMAGDFLIWRNRSVVVGHGEGRSCWSSEMGAGSMSPPSVLFEASCESKI